MRFALVGQPNCGKSTLFNQVAGYKAETGNFSGTTVTFTESRVRVMGEVVEIVDLPGCYSLRGNNPAEQEAANYLSSRDIDAVIDVADASHLASALELTLELLPLNKPVILALNMMDEAARLGVHIDGPGLQTELGIPVLPLVASKGRGVKGLFSKALEAGRNSNGKIPHVKQEDANDAITRHALAMAIAQKFSVQGERRTSWQDRLDDLLLHPFWGYVILLIVLLGFFQAVYGFGQLIEFAHSRFL